LSLRDLLELVTSKLAEAGIPYMLTGSLAGSYHGAPRATQDVDLVVEGSVASLLELAESLRAAGMYVSEQAVREAHGGSGMFNAIDPSTGWKVDFIIRKNRPFSESEFRARRDVQLLGMRISVASPEDMVVAKLEWSRLGDSERQLRDVAEILMVQGEALDLDRIERWVGNLGLESEWKRAKGLAELP